MNAVGNGRTNPYGTTKLKNTTCKPLKIGGSFKTSYVNYCLFLIVIVQLYRRLSRCGGLFSYLCYGAKTDNFLLRKNKDSLEKDRKNFYLWEILVHCELI